MTAVPDRTLRLAAWAVWWFVAAMSVVGVVLDVLVLSDRSDAASFVGDTLFAVLLLTFPLTGLLILRRQPRNTIGWLLQTIGLVSGLSAVLDNYVAYGQLVDPGSLPRPDVAAALAAGSWAPVIGLMGTFLILLYPDGHLPSPRWRPVAWLSAVTIVAVTVIIDLSPGQIGGGPLPSMANPLALDTAGPLLTVLLAVFLPLLPLCMVACALAVARRYRRSRGTERMQLKWLATAAGVVALLYLVVMASSLVAQAVASFDRDPVWLLVLQHIAVASFVLLPTAIGIAILRHRLYDIDLVIKRTLVYGALSVTLVTTYLVMVLLLQLVLRPVTSESDLAVAGSTLAVAAMFRPLRSRIQSAVDRRFFRSRYDANRTLESFGARLRNELDLDAVGADLRAAVRETVQPSHVSLWMRS